MFVCLKPESRAYEVPPGGLINGVSWSFVIVDVVRVCVCKTSFLILTNYGRRSNKITNKQKIQFAFSSFNNLGAHCIGQNKKFLLKTKHKINNKQKNCNK